MIRRIRALLEDCLAVAPPPRRPALERQMRLLDEAAERALPAEERTTARRRSAQGDGKT